MNNRSLTKYLQDLVEEDQKRLADLGESLKSAKNLEESLQLILPVAKACQKSAEDMMEVINKSGVQITISNLGSEAAHAIILIALHSYLGLMKKVKKIFITARDINPTEVPLQYLAVLEDRIEVITHRKQKFGTIQFEDNGIESYVPIENINTINDRRKKYHLPDLHIDEVIKKQKTMSEEQYLMNFAFMDKRIA